MSQFDLRQSGCNCLSLAACVVIAAASCAGAPAADISPARVGSHAVCEIPEKLLIRRIESYCRVSWRNARISKHDWDDCTHDVLMRLWDNLNAEQIAEAVQNPDSDSRRELNRAVWATTQRWRRQQRPQALVTEQVAAADSDEWPSKTADLQRVQAAIDSPTSKLTPTQREIVKKWGAGQTIREIAQELKLSTPRVSDEKYKAIQKLRQHFGQA